MTESMYVTVPDVTGLYAGLGQTCVYYPFVQRELNDIDCRNPRYLLIESVKSPAGGKGRAIRSCTEIFKAMMACDGIAKRTR